MRLTGAAASAVVRGTGQQQRHRTDDGGHDRLGDVLGVQYVG
jgi:hypothetical protein